MVKFVTIPEALDGDLYCCMWCGRFNAVRAVLNEDDTWIGVACCDNEAHGAMALEHHAMACTLEDPEPFYDPDEVA